MRFLPAVALLLSPLAAIAGENITAGVGIFDIGKHTTPQASLEYRGNHFWHGLRPIVGVSGTSDKAVYGYGGLNYDVTLGEHWVLTPNFAVGAFHKGDGKDLGHALEFRSGLEAGYRFDDASQLGVTFNHVSNASLGDKNPGAESLMLLYSHPVNLLGN